MSLGLASALVGNRAIVQGEGQHFGIQQRHQPTDRPGKAQVAITPAHEPLALQVQNPAGDQFRQHLGGGSSSDGLGDKHKGSLVGFAHFQGVQRHPTGTGEAFSRLRGLAILKRRLRRGAFHRFRAVGLTVGQPLQHHGQPPRRAVKPHQFRGESLFLQSRHHPLLPLGQGIAYKTGGQFFGAHFQQKCRHRKRKNKPWIAVLCRGTECPPRP